MSQGLLFSNSQHNAIRAARLRRNRIRSAIVLVLTVIPVFSFILLSHSTSTVASSPNPTNVAKTSTTQPVDAGGSSKPEAANANTTATAPKIVQVPDCVPTNSTISPFAPTLGVSSNGLIQSPMINNSYTVYGESKTQINNQISRCSPVTSNGVRYAASAEYAINWAFLFQSNESGLCVITNASVGLGISKTLPKWQPTSTSVALQSRWNTYIASLSSHEDGHINLDRQYANTILADLQNFPATSCDSINAAANARANSRISELNQANDQYDAKTGHGSTEGANL